MMKLKLSFAALRHTLVIAAACFALTGTSHAQTEPTYNDAEPLGTAMENWHYPYPVRMLQFEMDGRPVRMAYMDVRPENSNGQTIVLMHGKNFASDYWAGTIKAMTTYGFRVIAPDQIGFGKSSKPEVRYTFAQLAENTARLLDHLKVSRVAVIGNSMGGMLAVHFARRYPERVLGLVLENPLGLEDYVVSVPAQETPNLVKLEMAQTAQSYRGFVKSYFGTWKPDYERFVEQFARSQLSGDYPRLALISALTYQMIYEGPIINELPQLKVPTLLVIGQMDRTVFGRRFAPPDAVKTMGNFPVMGRATQQRIPGAVLKEFNGVGHVPHMELPERFHAVLMDFLYGKK
jgi:pimeloyl-ACP methyl ester carboxylesterase